MSDIKIVVAGAGGRMGRTVIRMIAETKGCVLSGALEAHGKPDLRQDTGILPEVGFAMRLERSAQHATFRLRDHADDGSSHAPAGACDNDFDIAHIRIL